VHLWYVCGVFVWCGVSACVVCMCVCGVCVWCECVCGVYVCVVFVWKCGGSEELKNTAHATWQREQQKETGMHGCEVTP